MVIKSKKSTIDRFRVWRDALPLEHRYTGGIGGQRFFESLKKRGVLLASRCSECGVSYLPPRGYCEKCFEATDDWVDVKGVGTLYSHTLSFETRQGRSLKSPVVFGLVKFEGIEGGIIHRIEGVHAKELAFGMKLKPKIKPSNRRTGSITDILFFSPAETA